MRTRKRGSIETYPAVSPEIEHEELADATSIENEANDNGVIEFDVQEARGEHYANNLDDASKQDEEAHDPKRPKIDLKYVGLDPTGGKEGRVQELPHRQVELRDHRRPQRRAIGHDEAEHQRSQHEVLADDLRDEPTHKNASETHEHVVVAQWLPRGNPLHHLEHDGPEQEQDQTHEQEGGRESEQSLLRVEPRLQHGGHDHEEEHPDHVGEHGGGAGNAAQVAAGHLELDEEAGDVGEGGQALGCAEEGEGFGEGLVHGDVGSEGEGHGHGEEHGAEHG